MKRTRIARTLVLVLTLSCVASAFASSENSVAIAHKTVLNATLSRTTMQVEFDQTLVSSQAAIARTFFELESGTSLLAINGVGTPVARVLNVELGELVASSMSANDLPHSADQLVSIGEPAIVHGVRIAGVSVSPLIATEAGLRAVRSVEYEIVTEGVGGVNEVTNPRPLHWAFESVLRRTIDNLDEIDPLIALDAPARYLIMGSTRLLNTDLAANVQYNEWLDLKRRRGYHLQIVTLAQVAAAQGDSTEGSIRSFISNTYHDQSLPQLIYAVIIGDVNGTYAFATDLMTNPEVPTESSVGDNSFFTVDGDDYISDVFHGRISAQTTAQYAQYFRKDYIYEATPYTENMNWFHGLTCVAGNFSDGGTYPVTPVWNVNWAREYVMRSGCISDADTFFYHDQTEDPGEWTEEIIADINEGVCAVWYRGWGSSQGWQYPVLFNSDIQSEINVGTKFPAVWGIVCGSGNYGFGSGQSFGETWTTGLGTPNAPNGAIVYLGASDLHTNTKHNNAMLAAMAKGMIVDGNRSTGSLSLAGKLEVYRQYPLERAPGELVNFYGFHVFNILGDPETPIYFCEPHAFTINAPTDLTRGSRYVNVTVTDATNGQPVENAIVGVRPGTGSTSWTAMTDAAGHAAVPANLSGIDNAQLTVWKHTYFMNWQDLAVATVAHDPFLGDVHFTAGADGQPNPGESVQITFDVRNVGTQSATWTITAASLDTLTSVTSGNATTPAIGANETGVTSPITVQISQYASGGAVPALALSFNDGQTTIVRDIRFTVAAPDPLVLELVVQDGDGILSPGETSNINIRIRNVGTSAASELTATVHSWDNAISFPDNSLNWTNVEIGQEALSASTFSASVPANVTSGRQIALRIVFSWNGAPFTWRQVFLTAGAVTPTVPTGPDEYGYYAYENIDVGFSATPTYSWTELDPEFGGSGATPHLVRDDTHVIIPIPAFTFYGQSYDSLSICSNGWVSFGHATLPEFRNWEIPSAIGPPAMLCPFWDDLISNGDSIHPNDNMQHEVFTRNDGNRFIIEWRSLNRAGLQSGQTNHDFCIFQCILEYPASGDGSVLFLYNQITNTDITNNYASVGIQDALHLRGLGLTFANTYIPSVAPLVAGRAIRFTTTPPDGFLDADDPREVMPTEFALHPAYPNPFNPATELRFDLSHGGLTTLKVYDTLGREVATLLDGTMNAGTHTVRFDASAYSSGVYFARLVSGANTDVQKIVLMK